MSVSIYSLPAAERNAALQGMRRSGKGRRVYAADATSHQGLMVRPSPKCVVSNARIRVAVCVLFRRIYGRAPTFIWGSPGHSAEAWDSRGNRLHLQQINDLPLG